MPRQSDCTLQPHNAAAGFPRSLTLARNAPRFPNKNPPRERRASKGDGNFGTLSSLPSTPTLLPQQPGIPNAVPGFFSFFQLFSIRNLFYWKINPIFLLRNTASFSSFSLKISLPSIKTFPESGRSNPPSI